MRLIQRSFSIFPEGQRDWVQVVCNGGVASAAALLYPRSAGIGELPLRLTPGQVDPPTLYSLACLSALCCSCGDTWASEVGSVVGGIPRLVTTWQKVPRGTNGGITGVGILCSIAGGLVVGLSHHVSACGDIWQYCTDITVVLV